MQVFTYVPGFFCVPGGLNRRFSEAILSNVKIPTEGDTIGGYQIDMRSQ